MSDADTRDEADEGESTRDSEPPRDSDPPRDSEPAERQRRRLPKEDRKARRKEQERVQKQQAMTRAIIVGVVALAAGGAAGWFGHIQQAKAKLRSDSPAAAGSATPPACNSWQEKLCADAGAETAACQEAKGALELFTPGVCEAALEALPATLTKVKASRASCVKLQTKLCTDLPPDSQMCTMIKEQTPKFPSQRCDDMLKNYDQVLNEVKQLEQQRMGGMQPGMAPPGEPPH